MYIKKGHGTYDLYGSKSIIWQKTLSIIEKVCKKHNFKYIRTPIFEKTNLFDKSIGSSTDIISKELYNFKDRGNFNISLRPEGTSGIVRSYIENELFKNNEITKLYYMGPMFRYEKIDEGRFREFYQFGVEVFKSNDPLVDAEIIFLAVQIFKELKLNDITVHINTIGEYEDKVKYKDVLKKYFKPHLDDLCDDCKRRYKKNPIRILDCKTDKRKEYVLSAPKIEDYLTEDSINHFNTVIKYLEQMNIPYIINRNLVRGLDYYTNTVFEIKTSIDNLGSANTICGGGRYNSLISYLSNENIPSIGFAIGIERLINILISKELIEIKDSLIDILIIGDSKYNNLKLKLLDECNNNNLSTEILNLNTKSKYNIEILDYDEFLFYDNKSKNKKQYNLNNMIKKLGKLS